MERIHLHDGYKFRMEKTGKKLHLVVCRAGVENVCRMETVKKMRDFTQNSDAHLFKGRLQLLKEDGVVKILVKNKKVGEIGKNELEQMCLGEGEF